MSGIAYVSLILAVISVGIAYVLFRRIWNIAAGVELFGFKLPKI